MHRAAPPNEMRALPGDVEAALLRALGAYVRAAQPLLLPPAVRPLKGFTPKSLGRRSAELLGLLDDEVQRRHVLEWLAGKAPLPRLEADVLRIAAQRSNGWQEALELRSARPADGEPGRQGRDPGPDPNEALERERDKVKRLRTEARLAREETRRTLEGERNRRIELERLVSELEGRLVAAQSEAERRRAEAATAAGDLNRVERQRQRAVERMSRERDAARTELRRHKRESSALKARIGELEAGDEGEGAGRRAARAGSPPAGRPAGAKRKPLEVPKGRFDTDPETLDAWLGAPEVHLLVDGYNVTLADGGFGDLPLERQRDRLEQEIAKLVNRTRAAGTIVFDGDRMPPGTAKVRRGRLKVEYSRPSETADDHLIERLKTLPPKPVIVATNDRELQGRAKKLGATVATSTQLLALVRSAGGGGSAGRKVS